MFLIKPDSYFKIGDLVITIIHLTPTGVKKTVNLNIKLN